MADEVCSKCKATAQLQGDIHSAPYVVWRVCQNEDQCGHREFVELNDKTALFDTQIIPLMKFASRFMDFCREYDQFNPPAEIKLDKFHAELKELLLIP